MAGRKSAVCLAICFVLVAFCEGQRDDDLAEFETLLDFFSSDDLDYLFGEKEASDGAVDRDEKEFDFDFGEEPEEEDEDLIEYDEDEDEDDEIDKSDRLEDTALSTGKAGTKQRFQINIQMPSVNITKDDTYLCTTVDLSKYDAHKTIYIVEYIPHAIQSVAHHMLLFGCTEPGSTSLSVWNCVGEMHGGKKDSFVAAPTCASGETILWAWAKDAPSFQLPKNVGFQVGAHTKMKYLTLQVHFKSMVAANRYGIGKISVSAVGTIQPQPNVAGIYVLASTEGPVPAYSKRSLDIVCKYNGSVVMHPFAFRTHTHSLGRMVYGYTVHNEVWKIIGEKNPQKPQAFYPVLDKNIEIKRGDYLAARCVMESKRNRVTIIGPKHTDEMCNFYFMYWTPRLGVSKKTKQSSCENGYPWVHWSNYFSHVPHTL